MPCPSHPLWLDHSNYTWRRGHLKPCIYNSSLMIMKMITIQSGTRIWNSPTQSSSHHQRGSTWVFVWDTVITREISSMFRCGEFIYR
jgi:hypothetical protein